MRELRKVRERWHGLDVTLRDLPLALAMFVLSSIPAMDNVGTQLGGLPTRPFDTWGAVAVALQCLPLALRRRATTLSIALVSLGFALDQLRGYHSVAGTALPIALLSAGSQLASRRLPTVLLLSAAYVILAVGLVRLGGDETVAGFVIFYLALVLAWGIGGWMRSNRALEAERRRRVAEDALTAERTRIARELHDVVTHHVTAMVVQAESARYLTAAPDRLDGALTAVTDTGRRAISDLRQLLDLLNPDHGTGAGSGAGEGNGRREGAGTAEAGSGGSGPAGDRTPPVGTLRSLVEQTRTAGQPVEFAEEGTPPSRTGSAGVVAYRVVQEALTNALKYDHGSRARVRVRYGNGDITVDITTDGTGTRAGSPGGSGRGLAGLRQRVDVLGGEFTAGPADGGGFTVRARIPAGSTA